ncbi:MAG TPA: hypothetical protein VKB31_04620 [Trueperaceae bacterium]|nr:hypothetical protein [Trueperaceae bacterium]
MTPPRRSDTYASTGARAWAPVLLAAASVTIGAALVASTTWAAAAGGGPPAHEQPLSVPGKPSIPAGAGVYRTSCQQCHPDRSRFATPAWRKGVAPAQIARTVLGRRAGHPAAVASLQAAWQVSGYLWTLPDDAADIRRGEQLALQADQALRSDALGLALFHWNDLQDLKSGEWVLNHTEGDVDQLMRTLAGSKYTSLSAGDRQDLVDYTFASFFVWPADW